MLAGGSYNHASATAEGGSTTPKASQAPIRLQHSGVLANGDTKTKDRQGEVLGEGMFPFPSARGRSEERQWGLGVSPGNLTI